MDLVQGALLHSVATRSSSRMQPGALRSAFVIGGFFTLSLAGCATRTHSAAPGPSAPRNQRGLSIAAVTYTPAETGKVRPDQIANTAPGDVLVQGPLDLALRRTLADVLHRADLERGSPRHLLSAEITEFLIDDLGFQVDWMLRVRYIVHDPAGAAIYDATKVTRRTTTKFTPAAAVVDDLLHRNATELAADDIFRRAVR